MIIPFGKHKGKTLESIADEALNYLGWLLTIPLNPILYMEVARVYAERTGFTGELPLPLPSPAPASVPEPYLSRSFLEEERDRLYAQDRTEYTGDIPLPLSSPATAQAPESGPPRDIFEDGDYFGDHAPRMPINRKTITLSSDDLIDLHLLLKNVVPTDKIESLALDVLNRILHGPQLSTSKTCLRQYSESYGVDMVIVFDKLAKACWISYGQTVRPGPSAYKIVTMGTRAAGLFCKVL
jgi:hypothetical protein